MKYRLSLFLHNICISFILFPLKEILNNILLNPFYSGAEALYADRTTSRELQMW